MANCRSCTQSLASNGTTIGWVNSINAQTIGRDENTFLFYIPIWNTIWKHKQLLSQLMVSNRMEWLFFLSYTHSSIHLRHHHIYVFFNFLFWFIFFSLVTHLRTIYINLDEIVFRLRCSLFFRFLFVLLISTIIWHTVRSERFNYFVKLKCTSNTKFHLLTLSTRCHDTHFW